MGEGAGGRGRGRADSTPSEMAAVPKMEAVPPVWLRPGGLGGFFTTLYGMMNEYNVSMLESTLYLGRGGLIRDIGDSVMAGERDDVINAGDALFAEYGRHIGTCVCGCGCGCGLVLFCVCVCVRVSVSVCLSVCLAGGLCMCVHMRVCLSGCLSVSVSVSMSV